MYIFTEMINYFMSSSGLNPCSSVLQLVSMKSFLHFHLLMVTVMKSDGTAVTDRELCNTSHTQSPQKTLFQL